MLPLRAEHAPWLLAAHAVVLAAVAWRVRDPRRLAIGALAALGWWAFAAWVVAPSLPVAWMQPLREGFTPDHLRYALADSSDTGKLPPRFLSPWLAPHLFGLRQAVARNLTCHGWTAMACGALASRGSWRGGAWVTAAMLVGPLGLTGALSEINGPSAGVYACAVAALLPDAVRPGRGRWVSAVGALVAAGLMLGVRDELSVVTTAVAAAIGLSLLPGWPGWAAWVDRQGERLRAAPWMIPAAIALWVAASWLLYDAPPDVAARWGQAGWLALALHPLDVWVLALPIVLLATMSPGVAWLAARGAWEAVRRPLTHGFLPVVVVVLFATSWIAGHGPPDLHGPTQIASWELYRYAVVFSPLVGLLAAVGARRGAVGPWVLIPPLPWLRAALPATAAAPWPWLAPATAGSAPDEVRAIVARLDEAPDCAIVSGGWAWGTRAPTWVWVAITRTAGRPPRLGAPVDGAWEEAVPRLVGGAACASFWRGMDCDTEGARCPPGDAPGAPFVPFVHPDHGVAWPDVVHTGFEPIGPLGEPGADAPVRPRQDIPERPPTTGPR